MPVLEERFYSTLGIARRAGQLAMGVESSLKAMEHSETAFLLIDEGASDNTKKLLQDACRRYSIPYYETLRDRLGQCAGKPGRVCAAVHKGSLAERLISYLSDPPSA